MVKKTNIRKGIRDCGTVFPNRQMTRLPNCAHDSAQYERFVRDAGAVSTPSKSAECQRPEERVKLESRGMPPCKAGNGTRNFISIVYCWSIPIGQSAHRTSVTHPLDDAHRAQPRPAPLSRAQPSPVGRETRGYPALAPAECKPRPKPRGVARSR